MDRAAASTDFTEHRQLEHRRLTTPPGGGNIALFAAGNHTATGNGAVGQILNLGTTTLTGNITAQGIGGATRASSSTAAARSCSPAALLSTPSSR